MKHKTMAQVITEYKERGNKAYYKAMIAVHDEAEAVMVHSSRAIIDRKKVTLKELRYVVDLLECMAERG